MPKTAANLLTDYMERFEKNYKLHYSCVSYASNPSEKIYSAVVQVSDGYVEISAQKDNTVRISCRYAHEESFPEVTVCGYRNCKLLFEILATVLECSKYGNATTQEIYNAIMCLVKMAYKDQF